MKFISYDGLLLFYGALLLQVLARIYSPDGGSEPIVVTDRMTVEEALHVFVCKDRVRPSLSLAITEQLPRLFMGLNH